MVMTLACVGLKVRFIGQCQLVKDLVRVEYWLTAVMVRFIVMSLAAAY